MNTDIPPLRKRTKEGVLYTRPEEIEKLIVETFELPFDAFIKRAKHRNRNHPDYLPSEVLVHRIRATRYNNSDDQFNALYTVLYERICRNCPSTVTRAGKETGELGKLLDVREFVVERFVILILKDRDIYSERLDFFEIRFDRVVSLLRRDAFRKVCRQENPLTPLEYDESGDIPEDVEEYSALLNARSMTLEDEITYRFQIRRAINSLPEMERRVIDMLEAGLEIESKNLDEPTITKVLGCTSKTVRNRRDRALRRIRETLGVEACYAD